MDIRIIAIYDNGGHMTADRYTVVTDKQWSPQYLTMLGLSDSPDDPRGFSQWFGGSYVAGGGNEHLGKRISFESLSSELQRHITRRVFTEALL